VLELCFKTAVGTQAAVDRTAAALTVTVCTALDFVQAYSKGLAIKPEWLRPTQQFIVAA
jgi:hypothetical protein